MGTLTDKSLDLIIANKAAFAHLKSLNLDNNALTEASEDKVKSLGNANYGEEQDPERASDDRYRYPAVGE